jgi:hypothetical protein
MDVLMTTVTNRDLLTIDGGQVERKPLHFFASLADVSDVMHFDLVGAVADGAIVQQPRSGSSGKPGWRDIQVSGCLVGLFDLLEGLVEEVNRSPSGLGVGNVFAIFAEDFMKGGSLFGRQSFGEGILQDVTSIVETTDILRQLVVVVPAANEAVVVVDDMIDGLIDEGIKSDGLAVSPVLLEFRGQFLEWNEESDIAGGGFAGLDNVVGRAGAIEVSFA